MNRKALIIFIKNPVLGNVKTRLAEDIGDKAALNVYKLLLAHTRHVVEQVDAARFLFYKDEIVDDDWSSDIFQKQLQTEGNLGTKMNQAFHKVFDLGFEKVLIIGSDCPEISNVIIDDAFNYLDSHDVVLGPANDGGYYLLGLKKNVPELFDLEEWSTENVLAETIEISSNQFLSYFLLEELIDIDTIGDLKNSAFMNVKSLPKVEKLNHQNSKTSSEIRNVFRTSYAVEAKLLNATDFPPLKRTLENFLNSKNVFYGFKQNEKIVAAIEINHEIAQVHIQSLVVIPSYFKKGLASQLIAFVLAKYQPNEFIVETGIDNIPAIKLYEKFGFKEVSQWKTDYGIRKVRFELIND